jgi:hypothetical protein
LRALVAGEPSGNSAGANHPSVGDGMLSLALPGRVFLCTRPTDMRKGFDSLAALVQTELSQDPLSGDLFVFRSRRGDRLKLLYWDRDSWGDPAET